jgi:hypothetical protein
MHENHQHPIGNVPPNEMNQITPTQVPSIQFLESHIPKVAPTP